MRFTVAIDGPAAAGKGTIAKAVAREFGFAHLDTGLLYRAVALQSLAGQDPAQAAQGRDPGGLGDPRLRSAEVAREASRVAAVPEVRAALLQVQKDFARRDGGAVLDGRDIGTVVCPEAEVKLFVTASPQARAERRHAEHLAAGEDSDLPTVLRDVRARDERDAGRDHAPLLAARKGMAVDDGSPIATSFPVFETLMAGLGAGLARG